jgi:glycerophosphoryl diester phosphodiesterase
MSMSVRPRRLPRKSGFAYLDDGPPGQVIAMAHRGGALHPANIGRENTAAAFAQAVELGYGYLETDVHATIDGVLLAFHDDRLDRVTDRQGPIGAVTYAEATEARIQQIHPVPTMAELLERFPKARFNIDLKSDSSVRPLAELIDKSHAWDRVLVGSFSWRRLREFRRLSRRRVATSAAPIEVAAFRLLPSGWLADLITGRALQALQIPVRRGWLTLVTPGLVRRAHAAGKHVQIRRLLDGGVDGLISDRTDTLKAVLIERDLWREYR